MDGDQCIRNAYASILSGDFEQAIGWFERAIALDPGNASYHYKCSITCARSGKWKQAEHHARHAVALAEGHAEFGYHLSTIEARLKVIEAEALLTGPGEPSEAIELLHEAAAMDPLNFEARLLLGAAYGSLKLYEPAIEQLREALRLHPQQEEARRMLKEYKRSWNKQKNSH